jgi:ankyrin repeat protein
LLSDGTQSLHLAVAEGNTLAVDLLLRMGCPPNAMLQVSGAFWRFSFLLFFCDFVFLGVFVVVF